ncbi:hypothetical protein BOTBODRAFT_643390 [Botryobasidium botryosum FD-172 SS1]|uniref:Reverse transcriptase domain-containing protein n=1 Tax=Botryobasidium botryosum (strain FD-172 SS1) TaxID=930990 RepID=A0A067M0J8_BOTB1|nr:hypothetical protein BOTBODRAFT_643390 [Botryobasidium botryosum FD-172 SS1]
MDGANAYEQIRVNPDHVSRMLFTTPDGTMESLVIQQGDCNGGATFQALMNYISAEHLGKRSYVYLDDIIIFSNTAKEHHEHILTVFDILRENGLHLSPTKMQLFQRELRILGHIITDEGIAMDPHKVDSILNWKTPITREQLSGFIGSVGYLAPGCGGIRIPLGVLTPLTSKNTSWKWTDTEQRTFQAAKDTVAAWCTTHRPAINYTEGVDPIWLVTDACLTGASGYVCQGANFDLANVITF